MNSLFCSKSVMAVFYFLLLSLLAPGAANAQIMPNLDVPYIPTRSDVVNGMLNLAGVNKDDMVYDLGCGDGRIVIAAARDRGAKGIGIDLNPRLIAKAQANAKKAGVEDRVIFKKSDLFNADFSAATVVTLYLLPEVNQKLRPQLWRQLKVGTRVVSHDFDMGPEWLPDKTEHIGGKTIYYWIIKKEHKNATN